MSGLATLVALVAACLALSGCGGSTPSPSGPVPAAPVLVGTDDVATCVAPEPDTILELLVERSSVTEQEGGIRINLVGRAVCEPDDYFFANWVAVLPEGDAPCPARAHRLTAQRTGPEEVELTASLELPTGAHRLVAYVTPDPQSAVIECDTACLDTGFATPWAVSNALEVRWQ